jgi:fibronectin-binding autotransporter adhesin
LPGTGTGGLTKQGAGTLKLLQPSTYTGPTLVEGGTLACATAASLAASPLQIASGATVDLPYSGTRTIPSLTINGVAKAAGVYGASTDPTYFTGSGTVTVQPPNPPTPDLPPSSFTMTGGVPTFTDVQTEAGWTYYLVYKNSLTDPAWTRITPGTPGGGIKTFTDTTTPLPADRFYRLEVTQ